MPTSYSKSRMLHETSEKLYGKIYSRPQGITAAAQKARNKHSAWSESTRATP